MLPKECFLARASMLFVGSDPIDKRPTNGVCGILSCHTFSMLSTIPSAKVGPRASAMQFLACGNVRSGHQQRIKRSRRNMSRDTSQPSGITSCSGASLSNHCFHCFSLPEIQMHREKITSSCHCNKINETKNKKQTKLEII